MGPDLNVNLLMTLGYNTSLIIHTGIVYLYPTLYREQGTNSLRNFF